jgi:predicted Fe-Mo cluster-binding NifX family protein
MKVKIIIPAEKKTMESPICLSFGRAPFFLVMDTESGAFEIIENKAEAVQGGAGIKATQLVLDAGAEAVIAYRMGQNAFDVLKKAKVQLLRAEGETAAEAAALFKAGKLKELDQIHLGFHGGGGA